MTVTIQNHVYPHTHDHDDTTVADLAAAAEELRACLPESMTVAAIPTRPGAVRKVIEGLIARGVRPGALPGWLLVILALVEKLPEIAGVIQKIIDAIRDGRRPADVLAESP
jgi:hypothetical protein